MRRSTHLDPGGERVLVSNDFGDYAVLDANTHARLLRGELAPGEARSRDLEGRSLLHDHGPEQWTDLERAAHATRKSFLLEGPSLHIFVVTLRCDHSCQYCQVSRAAVDALGFDMSAGDAALALDRVFESPSPDLTIEFQGGEPALRFDIVREIVEQALRVAHFKTWSVDTGPAEWTHDTVWDEIDAQLADNNVSGASGTLRRYLEYFAGEASHRLRGKVEYRGDGQFMLGDLLPGALSALGDGFKKAKAAAGSWNQKDILDAVAQREAAFAAARQAANADQWQLNAAVHYNPWADLSKEDFTPVAAAYKALVDLYACPLCKGMFHVTPPRGPKEALRCGCGHTNLNLTTKAAAA